MKTATDLLRTTAWRVSEVAKAVGFRSKVSLYVHFKRVLHVTPDEYRRRWAMLVANEAVRELLSTLDPTRHLAADRSSRF